MTFDKTIAELIEKEVKTRAEDLALRRALSAKNWWKILKKDGDKYKSCHGGTFEWPMPENGEHSKAVLYDGVVSTCHSGLHITSEPLCWISDGFGETLHRVTVDWFDPELKIGHVLSDKIAVNKLHIHREALAYECALAGIAYRSDIEVALSGRDQRIIMNGRASATNSYEMGKVSVYGNGFLSRASRCEVDVHGSDAKAIVGYGCLAHLHRGSLVARETAVVENVGTWANLALCDTSVAYVHIANGQRIYAANSSTVVILDDPKDLSCLILSGKARAITPKGKPIGPVNADKWKIVACKNGMRKFVAK